jgi:diguanylate cyclase (GGDEF)-like protein/PAS domain S-box-containing protein
MNSPHRMNGFMRHGNNNKLRKKLLRSNKLIVFGMAVCLLVWLIDCSVDYYFFNSSHETLLEEMFEPAPFEIWVRLVVATVIMSFSIYAQRTLTKRRQIEETLHQSYKFSKKILDSMNDAVSIINVSDYRLVTVNSVFLDELGIEENQALGRTCYEVTHSLTESCCHEDHPCPLLETVMTGNFSQAHHIHIGKDGYRRDVEISVSPVIDEDGRITRVVHVSRDITERKRSERDIEQLAYYDTLTGLPNRMLFRDRLKQALAGADRAELTLAILFLDLDRFKEVNDTLGHSIGDRLLKIVTERICDCLRKCDIVARLGGDEFVIVLSTLTQTDDFAFVARKILDAIRKPIFLEGHEIVSTGSIGISTYPKDGSDLDSLLKSADMAMYRAKDQGRNTYQFYNDDMNVQATEKMALETNMRHALEKNEFFLHYQPQLCLITGQITGFEALARWRTSRHEDISPSKFIPLAEETGLIFPIGEWVLRAACAHNKALQDAGIPPVRISVNLSARQFKHYNLPAMIAGILAETGLAPEYLELELTESTIMANRKDIKSILWELKRMGVSLAIDDFGTGYSSFSYLKHFPIDRIKIDRSFIREISTNPNDAAIARAIIAMSHSLGLKVIAEGVETKEQLDLLRSGNCDEIQGFYLKKPVPAEEVSPLLLGSFRDNPLNLSKHEVFLSPQLAEPCS